MTKKVIAISTIHMGLIAGSKGDKSKGQSPTPPKTVIIPMNTVFTPRTDTEEAELLGSKAIRYPNHGEDISRYPVFSFQSGSVQKPVEKTDEEIEAEQQETLRVQQENERIRQEKITESKRLQKEQQDRDAEEERKQKEADDTMRANAKAAEDQAAADLAASQAGQQQQTPAQETAKAGDKKARRVKTPSPATTQAPNPTPDADAAEAADENDQGEDGEENEDVV